MSGLAVDKGAEDIPLDTPPLTEEGHLLVDGFGSFLGLHSERLQLSRRGKTQVDAVSLFEPMVMSLHFGPKRDTHRLANAGYALALESLYDSPVNVGCITYVEIDGGRVRLERDIYIIDDELRQWFLEGRDNLTEMLDSERDPGRPDRCDEECPYLEPCRGRIP